MDTDISLFDPGPSQKKTRKYIQSIPESLPPEIEEGNIEYKLKLINPSPSRFEHLVTQMKWRLEEGKGEAIYEIGVEDNGVLVGLNKDDLEASMITLNRMAKRLGASITIIKESLIAFNKVLNFETEMDMETDEFNSILLNKSAGKNNNLNLSNDKINKHNSSFIFNEDLLIAKNTKICTNNLLSKFDKINHNYDNSSQNTYNPKKVNNENLVRSFSKINKANGSFTNVNSMMIANGGSNIKLNNGTAIHNANFIDLKNDKMFNFSDININFDNLSRLDNNSNNTSKLKSSFSMANEMYSSVKNVDNVKKVLEILVKKLPEEQQFIDIRIAVLGGVDSGKSTTLGVLTQGQLDNGRGRARLNLFRHLHEIQTGRTSSISHEILGFDKDGNVYNHADQRTVEEIVENSTKVVSFIDLCGHHKYLRTTIYGLTGYSPDCAMLVVAANMGIVGTLKEHLGYTLALHVPAFMVVTKLDACKSLELQHTLSQLERLVCSPGCNRVPVRVMNCDDACKAAANFGSGIVCPIIPISCVTGENIKSLLKFLHVLPAAQSNQEREKLIKALPELQIDEIYTLTNVGTIVGGTVLKGTIKEGEILRIGPNFEGHFSEVHVTSVHRNRLPCKLAVAGQTACVAIGNFNEFPVRKGQVLLSPSLPLCACFEFEAEIFVLFHYKNICRGFQVVVHIGNVRQTAAMDKMNKDPVKMNEKAIVTFKFITRPEYIRIGHRLLFRQGRTKGMGQVRKIYPLSLPNK